MNLTDYTMDYLVAKFENIKINKRAKVNLFECPLCKKPNCQLIPNSGGKLICHACGKSESMGNIFEIMKQVHNMEEADVVQDMKELLKLDFDTETEKEDLLLFYEKHKFDLVPLARDKKIPIEKEWTIKEHKNREEWIDWREAGANIGVKTGKMSNVTVIDIDQKPIPKEIAEIIQKNDGTLYQETNKGYHFFYIYEPDFPKTRIEELKIDIENNGGQVVVPPSTIEGIKRKLNMVDVQPMPKELKELLLSKIKSRPKIETETEKQSVDFGELPANLDFSKIPEGSRHHALMHLGGICRKELNMSQTKHVMTLLNRHFVKPPLNYKDFESLIDQLSKYMGFDEKDLAGKIIEYLKVVEDGTAKDIRDALGFKGLGEEKARVDKAISYLVKEGYLIKKRRMYHIIKKAEWKDTFPKLDNKVHFDVPYFNESAVFNWGDMVLLGSRSKFGKTTISMNMLKHFIDQGIRPYYISLETGSRFIKTAISLGMKEGDFLWDFQADPGNIELEPNAVTILDWLMIEDKASTDAVMKHFVEQLYKTNGFLIIFMQCKQDGGWFAPNMVGQFPAFMARYLYDDDNDGSTGKWIVDAIREPKLKSKSAIIPCRYEWETKKLLRITDFNGKIPDSI